MCVSEEKREEAEVVEVVWMREKERRSWRGLKEAEKEELCMGHVRSEKIVRECLIFDLNFNVQNSERLTRIHCFLL